MQFFLALIGFVFLLFTVGFAAVLWKVRRRFHDLRDAMQDGTVDEAFQRMANKYYYREKRDEGPMFDEDYFKGDPNRDQNTKGKKQQKKKHTWRSTKTADGITIYDDRDPIQANKKIFAQDEGEYVDFKEV